MDCEELLDFSRAPPLHEIVRIRTSQETMRHNIRPFVTVHRNRWSKSRKSSLWGAHLLEEAGPKPSPTNASAVPPRQEGDPAPTTSAAHEMFPSGQVGDPPSVAPAGRILPCLLQSEGQIASQKEPVRRTRATNKRKAVDTKAPRPDVTAVSTERSAAEAEVVHSASEQDSGLGRRDSRIQDRWVRKTDIRLGERWKRRLCDAVR